MRTRKGRIAACAIALVAASGTAGAQQAENTWRGLQVAPEARCTPYDANDYGYSQSVETGIINRQGGIWSPYTCERFTSRRQTDIEHIVARSEAHDSGLCAADAATKRGFASDPLNLTLASPQVNRREKVAKDAADWLPDENACWYVARTIEVRRKYGLTIDRGEAAAIDGVLRACRTTAPACAAFRAPVRAPAPPRRGNARGAERYRRCADLRAAGWSQGVRADSSDAAERGAYEQNRHLDGDGDGHACQ